MPFITKKPYSGEGLELKKRKNNEKTGNAIKSKRRIIELSKRGE